MAASGYPDEPLRGSEIRGLAAAASDPKVKIFHAGTRRVPAPAEAGGEKLLADGGRVLGVTALGPDLAAPRTRAYAVVYRIDWPGGFCRRDIAAPR
jgi:phosphoribosylamine---glycine ligase